MAATEELTRSIQSILQQQGSAGRPSAAVCSAIANLKDLVELNGPVSWRRGAEDGGFRGFRGAAPPPRPATARPAPFQGSGPPPPVPKYQSQFKNSNQPVEEKILNNIILSKLNKFSPKTYDEIRDFLYQILGSGEVADLQEMTRDFMRLVFKKAAIEEMFCPLYAKLLCEISGRYRVILEEMYALQRNYIAIFDDVKEAGADYDAFVEQQKSKQFRVGYSQFLAELAALELLDMDLLKTTFQRILTNMLAAGKEEGKRTLLEEYADCLVRMGKVLRRKGSLYATARSTVLQGAEEGLTELLKNSGAYSSLSTQARFILMDVDDCLRDA